MIAPSSHKGMASRTRPQILYGEKDFYLCANGDLRSLTKDRLSGRYSRVRRTIFTGFDMAGDALLEAGIRVDFKSEVVPAIGFDEAPV